MGLTLFPETMIADDRGTAVPLWSHRRAASEDRDEDRDLAQRIAYLGHSYTRRVAILFGLVPAVTMIVVTSFGLSFEVAFGMIAVGAFAMGLGIRGYVRRRIAPVVRRTLLAECRCASCAYDLRGLAAELDGCVPCPECHAAWLLDPEALAVREARERLFRSPRTSDDGETSDDRRFRSGLRSLAASLGFRRHFATLDARERMVGLVDPGLFARRPPRWAEVPKSRRTAVRARLWAIGLPWRLLLVLCFVPSLIFNMLGIGRPAGVLGTTPATWILLTFSAVWMPILMLMVLSRPITRSGKPIVRIMLREGHCPSCAASLVDAAPSPDGKIECPACRAAWRGPLGV